MSQINLVGDDIFSRPPVQPEYIVPAAQFTTPFQQSQLTNQSYLDLLEKITRTIIKMKQTRLYRDAIIYLGVKSATDQGDPIDTHEKTIEDELNAKISHLESQIKRLNESKTEEEVDMAFGDEYKPKLADKSALIPKILIKGTKKFPIYASVNQEIDRRGMGAFGTKISYRNPFGLLDVVEINYQKAVSRHDNYNYGIKWKVPRSDGSEFGLEGRYNFERICRGLDQGATSYNAFYDGNDYKIELDIADREPAIDLEFNPYDYRYLSSNFMRPSNKRSLRLWSLLFNNIQFADIMTGSYADTSVEFTVPYFSEAQFIKYDLNLRHYFDLYNFSKYFSSRQAKLLFKNSNMELAASLSSTLRRTDYVSDNLTALTMRGFQTSETPNLSPVNLKSALKFNIYNFPLLHRANIRVFSYLSGAMSFDHTRSANEDWRYRPSIRAAGGFGAFFELATFARLELIYNLFQYQRFGNSKQANFQIRIGIYD